MATLALVTACDSSGSEVPVDSLVIDAGPTDHHPERVGVISLLEGSYTSTFAMVQDRGEVPAARRIATEGDCAIYKRPAVASCTPACSTGVCTAPGTCTPWPANASAGPITVTGLRAPLVFRPSEFGYIPEPAPGDNLFDPGAAIHVAAAGGVTPAFTADVRGVPPLEAPFQNLTLVDGRDETIRWTAAGDATIQLSLVVGWHGAPYEAMLLCETADDGELVLSGDLIRQLPRASSGLEPHPSWIARMTRAIVEVPAGPIEVIAGSQQSLYFTHP